MRLIDADELKRSISQNNKIPRIFQQVINAQPTAYSVDKVVEELDKSSDYYECEEQGREHVQMVDLTDAIEIVKQGGVYEAEQKLKEMECD